MESNGRPFKAVKRKHNSCNIKTKLEALERLKTGKTTIKILAEELQVGESTIRDWKKKEAELFNFSRSVLTPAILENRCTLKTSVYQQVNEALYIWFLQQRSTGAPVTGPIIQAKAKILSKLIDVNSNFGASDGWFSRWKKRYGIRFLSITGEKLSSNKAAAEDYIEKFAGVRHGYSPQQIYNADESGLFFKQLPKKSYVSKNEKSAPGYKMSKERLSILACSNVTGNHKLPLMVIGKSAKPRVLKNMDMNNLKVHYRSQKKAWMNSELFTEWFEEKFVPSVKKFCKDNNLPVRALLLVDNAPCHPSGEELQCGDIKTIFLPPNATPLIQPMDQEILQNLKQGYKKRLLEKILSEERGVNNLPLTLTEKLKKVNIKNVIDWIESSWADVSCEAIRRSWKNLWPDLKFEDLSSSKKEDQPEKLLDLVKSIPGCEEANTNDVEEWTDTVSEEVFTDEDIIAMVQNDDDSVSNSEDEDDSSQNQSNSSSISHSEAVTVFEKAFEYISNHSESTPIDISTIKHWLVVTQKSKTKSQRQAKLTDFFKH